MRKEVFLSFQKFMEIVFGLEDVSCEKSYKCGHTLESVSHSIVSDSLWLHGLYSPWNSPDQNTGVDSLSLLQGIFPTHGSNPGLLHCSQILYQLSHKGSPCTLSIWYKYSVHAYTCLISITGHLLDLETRKSAQNTKMSRYNLYS